jgi:SAM-dependent methyltransferase
VTARMEHTATRPRCPVCDGEDTTRVADFRYRHPTFSGMARFRCDDCGGGFADPMPSEASLDAFNSSYFDSAHGGAETSPVVVAFHSAIARIRVAHVEQYTTRGGIDIAAVLEVGPGAGHFARHWMARHPQTRYVAVESDTTLHAALVAAGVSLRSNLTPASGEGLVDLVVMSHVLEHTSDPVGFLRAASSSLRSGGALFIEVPCRDWEHKDQDEPHLLFFDKPSMQRLLERAGFVQAELSYHGERIDELRARGLVSRVMRSVRMRLLNLGVVAPFSRDEPGLDVVEDRLGRAAVKPSAAHREHVVPAWWLRAVAVKR